MPHAKTHSIRIILVDDHTSFRQGLRSLLDSYADIEIVGEAENGEEVVHSMPYLCPSAIVMDINMPKLNGIEATRTIKAHYPHVVIVGLCVHADNVSQTAMVAASAKSVLSKGMAGLLLYRQIKAGVENLPPPPNAAQNSHFYCFLT
jgi:DNA-binding NarL/FixJ family response regulator